MLALGEKAQTAVEPLSHALADAAPNVRMAAAEALCQLGRVDDAMPVIVAGLSHETAFVRLRAINALDRLGERARPALAAIRQARMKTKGHVVEYLGRMVGHLSRRLSATAPP